MNGTILFPGSPYPSGHAVKDFKWFATKHNDGSIYFQLHLETEDYYKATKADSHEDNESDWTSPIVWENYGHCTLSSVAWGEKGFKVADNESVFKLNDIDGNELEVDIVEDTDEDDIEEHAIWIYLLGHDSCANHKIKFTQNANGTFNIHWRGDIALAYAGEDEYGYSFNANINNVQFGGIVGQG